jgi:hypothetical protein
MKLTLKDIETLILENHEYLKQDLEHDERIRIQTEIEVLTSLLLTGIEEI